MNNIVNIDDDRFEEKMMSSDEKIKRLMEEEVRDKLEKLEKMDKLYKDYVMLNIGGVLSIHKKDDMFTKYSYDAFIKMFAYIKDNKGKSLIKTFLEDDIDRYERVVFKPTSKVRDGEFNYWKGWSISPIKGICDKYLDHIKDNICDGNMILYEYILDWMAQILQQPEKKLDKCLVLRGAQGTGKGEFVRHYSKLFGDTYHHLTNLGPLVNRFNSELANKLLVFADEVTWGGRKDEGNRLKTFISEDKLNIEIKHKDVVPMNNFARLIIASNNEWVVPVEDSDRRYLVVDVSDKVKQNRKYFGDIQIEMENGGYQALMYMLMNRDISKRDWENIPKTKAKEEQKMHSFDPIDRWVYESLSEELDDNMLPWNIIPSTPVSNKDTYQGFINYCQARSINFEHISSQKVVTRLMKMFNPSNSRSGNKKTKTYDTLQNMQDKFDKYFNTDFDWS